MPVIATDAVVLHAFDYLETSRILRLATREAGVLSVIARGARRSARRYGSALDLFAGGVAEIHTRPGRELQTLTAFDVTRPRWDLAADLDRFTAASAIAELVMRFAGAEGPESLFEGVVAALDLIARSPGARAGDMALAGAWRLVAELGFSPALDDCASCHAVVAAAASAPFSHRVGGLLCPACAPFHHGRPLPPSARDALRGWLRGEPAVPLDDAERRAHQRLLREFLGEHLADDRPLRAYAVWEHADWAPR